MDIYSMTLNEKFEELITISDNIKNIADKRAQYLLNITRVPNGWVYTILSKSNNQLIKLEFIPEDGLYQNDDIYNLNLHEFDYTVSVDKKSRSSLSIMRVHNGWIQFDYNSKTYKPKTVYYVPQFLSSGGSGTGSTYTNTTPIISSHGGIDVGMTFNNVSMQDMFDLILYPDIPPTRDINIVSLNLNISPTSYEVGSIVSFTMTSSYYPGNIDSKDSHPDIDLTGPLNNIIYSGANSSNGVVSNHTVTQGANIYQVSISYDAGTGLYYTSNGNESHIFDAERVATTKSTTKTIMGYYNYYIGSSNTSMPTGSTEIRLLTHSQDTNTFSYTIPANTRYIAFYLQGAQKTVVHAIDPVTHVDNASSFNISGPYNVDDAGGNSVQYYKYEQDLSAGYSVNVQYDIEVS